MEDDLLEVILTTLDTHTRKVRDVRTMGVSLDIHCLCGWTHKDQFIQNPQIHRRHVAVEVYEAVAKYLDLPEDVAARIDVSEEGKVAVNLKDGMSGGNFATMLRTIATAFESGEIRRTQ